MNGSAKFEPTFHSALLSIGSNIEPARNIPRAIERLREVDRNLILSTAYETKSVGSIGPNFINLVVKLSTQMNARQLKDQTIAHIEAMLRRVRTADKNSPRTIDLDIIVFDGQVLDSSIWKRVHLAVPLAELLPGLVNPLTGETLQIVARQLQAADPVIPRPDLHLTNVC